MQSTKLQFGAGSAAFPASYWRESRYDTDATWQPSGPGLGQDRTVRAPTRNDQKRLESTEFGSAILKSCFKGT